MPKEIAQTILNQLGGHKFIVMTGAKNFVAKENGLTFRIPGKNFAKSNINHVEVILKGDDTYTILFSRIRAGKMIGVANEGGVYFDQLQAVFTEYTGLATHL